LTIPGYTHPAIPDGSARDTVPLDTGSDGARHRWLDRLDRSLTRLRTNPRSIQWVLDLLGVGFILLAFYARTGLSAEFLFHCVFVLLVLHGFLFGIHGTLLRIGLASIPLLLYAEAAAFGLDEPSLELTEWPLMFVIAALVAWMAERLHSTSRRYAALFRRASERLLTVEEDERRRIAGELHDGVGQILTAVSLTLDAVESEPDPAVARQHVASARRLADTALAATRDLSHRMRPSRLEERGLVPAVRDLASQSGFPVVVHADDDAAASLKLLSPTATVELYRIVQEALSNAARHSGASGAHVSVTRRDQRVTVVVADEGRGFDPGDVPGSGIGLAGMLERSRLLGGQYAVESAPQAGTRVVVSLPIVAAPVAG
jgi:signal transduction histidine kinase